MNLHWTMNFVHWGRLIVLVRWCCSCALLVVYAVVVFFVFLTAMIVVVDVLYR